MFLKLFVFTRDDPGNTKSEQRRFQENSFSILCDEIIVAFTLNLITKSCVCLSLTIKSCMLKRCMLNVTISLQFVHT